MIDALKFCAMGLCLVLAATRLPDLRHGRPGLFAVFLLTAVVIALNVDAVYLAVDRGLGGVNVAYLLVRFLLLGIFGVLAVKVAAAYQRRGSARFVAGPPGAATLAVSAVAMLVLFSIGAHPESSPGLQAYRDDPLILWFAKAGMLYPAFVAACLLGPVVRAAATSPRRPARAASALLALGFVVVLAITVLPLEGPVFEALNTALSYAATLSIGAGLTLIWIARRRDVRNPAQSPLKHER